MAGEPILSHCRARHEPARRVESQRFVNDLAKPVWPILGCSTVGYVTAAMPPEGAVARVEPDAEDFGTRPRHHAAEVVKERAVRALEEQENARWRRSFQHNDGLVGIC